MGSVSRFTTARFVERVVSFTPVVILAFRLGKSTKILDGRFISYLGDGFFW